MLVFFCERGCGKSFSRNVSVFFNEEINLTGKLVKKDEGGDRDVGPPWCMGCETVAREFMFDPPPPPDSFSVYRSVDGWQAVEDRLRSACLAAAAELGVDDHLGRDVGPRAVNRAVARHVSPVLASTRAWGTSDSEVRDTVAWYLVSVLQSLGAVDELAGPEIRDRLEL